MQVSNWNTKCNIKFPLPSPPSLICSACLVISEGVLWQEANALQFPELPATVTSSHCQGHLQQGNFHLSCHFSPELVRCAHSRLLITVLAIWLEPKFELHLNHYHNPSAICALTCVNSYIPSGHLLSELLNKLSACHYLSGEKEKNYYLTSFWGLSALSLFKTDDPLLHTLWLCILCVDSTWSQCAHWWMMRSMNGCRAWLKSLRRTWDLDCSGTSNSSPGGPPTTWVRKNSSLFSALLS